MPHTYAYRYTCASIDIVSKMHAFFPWRDFLSLAGLIFVWLDFFFLFGATFFFWRDCFFFFWRDSFFLWRDFFFLSATLFSLARLFNSWVRASVPRVIAGTGRCK